MSSKRATGARRGSSPSTKTSTTHKRGGYSSSGKPVSQLKPPPSGPGAGAKK